MCNAIAELVGAIVPYDLLEAEQICMTLAWIDSGAPLHRTQKPATPPQHLVAYFVLVDPARHKMLLVDHKTAGLWLPSGGHVEPGEHPRDTVIRELCEELQLEARFLWTDPIFLTVTKTVGQSAGHTDVSLWYVLHADCTQGLNYDSEEFHGVAWFALDGLPLTRTDPHLGRFSDNWPPNLGREVSVDPQSVFAASAESACSLYQ